MVVPSARLLRPAVLMLVCLAASAAPAPADAAPKLKKGVYDCMRYDYYSGMLMFSSTIKLKGKGRYEHAFGRKKANLTDKTTGKYRIRGKRVKFKGGGMAKAPAKIERSGNAPAHLNLLVDGEASGISCYYVKTP